MSAVLRRVERLDARVMGALRCVDAVSGMAVGHALTVEAASARVLRNRSGLYVLTSVSGLSAHRDSFEAPPATPAIGALALTLTIRDPQERYLPRRCTLALPRQADPARADQPDSLFRPVEVALYPAPAAPTGHRWSLLRVTLSRTGTGELLGGALLSVRRDGAVLARGLSDWRGEALVAVPGVPVTTWSDQPGAVVVTSIDAQLDAVFDPASGTRITPSRLRSATSAPTVPLVDPDRLDAQRLTLPNLTQNVTLAAGATRSLSLALTWP